MVRGVLLLTFFIALCAYFPLSNGQSTAAPGFPASFTFGQTVIATVSEGVPLLLTNQGAHNLLQTTQTGYSNCDATGANLIKVWGGSQPSGYVWTIDLPAGVYYFICTLNGAQVTNVNGSTVPLTGGHCDSGTKVQLTVTAVGTPTGAPTAAPTAATTTGAPSTSAPTGATTTSAPTGAPNTTAPTAAPNTTAPTTGPTASPNTTAPTAAPNTTAPTSAPATTGAPSTSAPNTSAPTGAPATTGAPSTFAPNTSAPTAAPNTTAPTAAPNTTAPTGAPSTGAPSTGAPSTSTPTGAPTAAPTTGLPDISTGAPSTSAPTTATGAPSTSAPTGAPSTSAPTGAPSTSAPTGAPTGAPTTAPTAQPTSGPTAAPTPSPTAAPTPTPAAPAPTPAPAPAPTPASGSGSGTGTGGPVNPTNTTRTSTCGNSRCESWLGENCTGCPADCGTCPSCDNICGNNRCEPLESGCNCPQDCGFCCLNGRCEENENAVNCPRDCSTDLVGYVDDISNLAALVNASVECRPAVSLLLDSTLPPYSVRTNRAGNFRLANLTSGIYTCTATYAGYYPNSASIDFSAGLRSGPQPEYRISLSPQVGSLSGQLRDRNFGGYLREVNVSCSRPINAPGNVTEQYVLRRSYENYYFGDLKAGVYTCWAKKRGYSTVTQTVTINIGANTVVDFWMTPINANVTVMVTENRCGQPLTGSLTCQSTATFNSTYGGLLTGRTSFSAPITNGMFNTTAVPNVDYVCTATVAGYATHRFVIDCLTPASSFAMNISLYPLDGTPSTISLNVRAVDSKSGAQLSGVTLRLFAPGFPNWGESNINAVTLATKTTGNNGASWDLLPSTSGTVYASLAGYAPAYAQFDTFCFNNTVSVALKKL